jgi:hypothetical protein
MKSIKSVNMPRDHDVKAWEKQDGWDMEPDLWPYCINANKALFRRLRLPFEQSPEDRECRNDQTIHLFVILFVSVTWMKRHLAVFDRANKAVSQLHSKSLLAISDEVMSTPSSELSNTRFHRNTCDCVMNRTEGQFVEISANPLAWGVV